MQSVPLFKPWEVFHQYSLGHPLTVCTCTHDSQPYYCDCQSVDLEAGVLRSNSGHLESYCSLSGWQSGQFIL